MVNKKPYLLTSEGYERLSTEAEHLRTVKREEVASRLQRALEDGQDDDFVDNAELEAARNEQSFLEGRILELEEILRNHQIISEDVSADGVVRVGSFVTVRESGYDEEERYHLVGAAEADPTEGRISNESPLGRQLLGKKVNDKVRFMAPSGQIEFTVIKIE